MMFAPIKITSDQMLSAKYHFSNAADEANVSFFLRESMAGNGSFHADQMLKQLSRACLALGVTVDANGKVEAAAVVVPAPVRAEAGAV